MLFWCQNRMQNREAEKRGGKWLKVGGNIFSLTDFKSLICLAYQKDWKITWLVHKYLYREKIKSNKGLSSEETCY